MLTSTCYNCGAPKAPSEYENNYCSTCTKVKQEAAKDYSEKNPDAPISEALNFGRKALLERAHHANRNFTDPRSIGGMNGMIPMPPQRKD